MPRRAGYHALGWKHCLANIHEGSPKPGLLLGISSRRRAQGIADERYLLHLLGLLAAHEAAANAVSHLDSVDPLLELRARYS